MRLHLAALLLVIAFVSQGQPIDSLENVLATAQGDKKVKTLNELFRAHINADPVKALGYTREALSLANEIGDRKGIAASYNNLGVAYKNQGAVDKALEYYLISLKTYTDLDNKEGIATTKNNIGTIYSLKKDHGQAMKYFEESQQLLSEIHDQQRMVGALNNLGNLHSELQLYEQALKYYSQSWQLSEKIGKPFSEPLSNIGNLFFRQGNYQRAVEYYDRALELSKKENNRLDILNTTSNLGEVYVRAGRPKEAQRYLDEAYALCKEMQASYFEPQILKSQAANLAAQGKMKEAYQKMLDYDKAKDRIFNEESTRKIAQMEMALDLQEKEKEVDGLKKEDEIKSLQLRNTRMVITSVVLGVVLLVAGFNLFFARRKPIRRVSA